MKPDLFTPQRPPWVKIGLWGLPTRGSALVFLWLSILLAAASTAYGVWDVRFFAITIILAVPALWYWRAIRWVDAHGGWPAVADGSKSRLWVWTALAAGLLGVALLVATLFVFFAIYQLPQDSMYPGLPAGTRIIAMRRPYRSAAEVRRGDIVVCGRKESGQQLVEIWRVVGLPGDTLLISEDAVVVNGKALPRTKLRTDRDKIIYSEENGAAVYEIAYDAKPPAFGPPRGKLTVPAGRFFVMGDNRHHAMDSRYFEPIAFESIIAKMW